MDESDAADMVRVYMASLQRAIFYEQRIRGLG